MKALILRVRGRYRTRNRREARITNTVKLAARIFYEGKIDGLTVRAGDQFFLWDKEGRNSADGDSRWDIVRAL